MFRLALFPALLCLATVAAAQSELFQDPFVCESDGVLQGIAWKTKGGQPFRIRTSDGREQVSYRLSFYGNDALFDQLLKKTVPSTSIITTQITHFQTAQDNGSNLPTAGSGLTGAKTGYKASRITFGGGSTSRLNVPGGATVEANVVSLDYAKTTATKEMSVAIKRQKLWQSSAFRITVGSNVVDSAVSFDPIVVNHTDVGDLDGDGVSDLIWTGDTFAFEVPKGNTAMFDDLYAGTLAGSPKEVPVKVEYLDEDGLTIFDLQFVVTVNGVSPSDMFSDPSSPANNVRIFTKIDPRIAVVMERL